MASATDDKTHKRYRSGDAARLAKMPVTTLRIWERRYGVVAPPKSESGQRLYSEDDVRRLSLLKGLVQRGHPIGTIAKLDRAQLEQLALGRSGREFTQIASGPAPLPVGISLAVIGDAFLQRLESEHVDLAEAGVVNMVRFASLDEASSRSAIEPADILIITVTSLHEDVASQVLSLGEACQARAIAVAYGFGTGRAIQMLRLSGVRLYREPDSRFELRQVLEELARMAQGWGASAQDGLWLRAARRFDDQTLTGMVARSSTIACECPRHLAELIMKLSAFEKYSDECGSRSVEDILLHRNLGDVANRALAMFESALARIANEEGLIQERLDD
ncbi:MerR family transcriptional regulator [Paraburkholderia polaris]|nr:MerR family transcriptional regulator [Paraburkholderia polaris]